MFPDLTPTGSARYEERMDGFRCPKCHALSYPGLMGFPRCHRCHEQLRQCRYCAHQTGGLCRLDDATRPRLRCEDGKPFCDAFGSGLADSSPAGPLRRPFSGAARVTALSTAVVIAMAILVAMAAQREALIPQIEANEAAIDLLDNRATATFSIVSTQADARDRRTVYVRVDPGIEEFYVIEEYAPAPLGYDQRDPRQLRYELSGDRRLDFSVTLLRRAEVATPRQAALTVRLLASHDMPLGSATVPIRAAGAVPPPTGRLP
ncbi:MAG: hypothetical protein HZB16_09955 [Armatimonadetes bacterium]|nr:hypothetical protein [Armatimonadota bacterium]